MKRFCDGWGLQPPPIPGDDRLQPLTLPSCREWDASIWNDIWRALCWHSILLPASRSPRPGTQKFGTMWLCHGTADSNSSCKIWIRIRAISEWGLWERRTPIFCKAAVLWTNSNSSRKGSSGSFVQSSRATLKRLRETLNNSTPKLPIGVRRSEWVAD